MNLTGQTVYQKNTTKKRNRINRELFRTDGMPSELESLLAKAHAKGTDKQFREWIKRQPSCISGLFSERIESGEGRSIPAHVRRASEAGTAYKPDFSCIPLTFDEHNAQSWYGEDACLNKFMPKRGGFWSVLEAKDWFDEQRVRYLRLWLDSV